MKVRFEHELIVRYPGLELVIVNFDSGLPNNLTSENQHYQIGCNKSKGNRINPNANI